MNRRKCILAIVGILVASVLVSGCLTKRQRAQVFRQPTNRVFEPGVVTPLGPGEAHRFGVYDQGGSQNVCVLQLAKDANFSKRYHKEHDLTLLVVSGSAIVVVEETRYFLTPNSAVFLPRYTGYTILPHEGEDDFVALMIYSPPYEGKDVALED